MSQNQSRSTSTRRRYPPPATKTEPICPLCGGETVAIHGRLVCTTCRTIVQTCCE